MFPLVASGEPMIRHSVSIYRRSVSIYRGRVSISAQRIAIYRQRIAIYRASPSRDPRSMIGDLEPESGGIAAAALELVPIGGERSSMDRKAPTTAADQVTERRQRDSGQQSARPDYNRRDRTRDDPAILIINDHKQRKSRTSRTLKLGTQGA
ncbi:hypothetical protein ACXR0O_18775 [Verrucomicrobiota bacterium sgz303538]